MYPYIQISGYPDIQMSNEEPSNSAQIHEMVNRKKQKQGSTIGYLTVWVFFLEGLPPEEGYPSCQKAVLFGPMSAIMRRPSYLAPIILLRRPPLRQGVLCDSMCDVHRWTRANGSTIPHHLPGLLSEIHTKARS